MKTEHHATTHIAKSNRVNAGAKVAGATAAPGDANAAGVGGFLALLTQMGQESATPGGTGVESLVAALSSTPEPANTSMAGAEAMAGASASGGDLVASALLVAQLTQSGASSPEAVSHGSGQTIDLVNQRSYGGQNLIRSVGVTSTEVGVSPKDVDGSRQGLHPAPDLTVQDKLQDSKGGGAGRTPHMKLDNSHSAVINAHHDALISQLKLMPEAAESPQIALLAARGVMSDDGLRQAERGAAKKTVSRNSDGVDGAWGAHNMYSASPLGVAPTTPSDALVAPELMVAEQVSYWITQDIQNAELKLDGFDGLPVDVSISVRGNEATVDFRTDHEGIRDVLQNAESHLKDALAREGLGLSGVSVGSSMQQGAHGSNPRRPADTTRRIEINASSLVTSDGTAQLRVKEGRSIDVFV
jgi:hypothetical protein